MGNGDQRQTLVGERFWRRHGVGPALEPLAPLRNKAQRHQRPVQQARGGCRYSSGTDRQYSLRHAADERRRAQGRHQHGPGACESARPGHDAAEPGARLRAADHRLSRDQFLDGLQFAHLLAERRFACADGSLSFARVRQPLRKSRQQAHAEHPRSREGRRVELEPQNQLRGQLESSTNISPACAKWKSASIACAATRTKPRKTRRTAASPGHDEPAR